MAREDGSQHLKSEGRKLRDGSIPSPGTTQPIPEVVSADHDQVGAPSELSAETNRSSISSPDRELHKKAPTTLLGAEATLSLCFVLLFSRRERFGERLSVRCAHASYVIPALSRLHAGIRAERDDKRSVLQISIVPDSTDELAR